ncbi:MAG: type VI secretion system baseplate subunit TssF [Pseudomonadota bacterium]
MSTDQLLAYFERELVTFRDLCREYAAKYPRIAGNLHMAGDMRGDPHIERMIEAFALIAARVSKRLDDDYPQFTELLLDVLMPHYLRSFPSTAIAHLDISQASKAEMTEVKTIPRGTELTSAAVQGVSCTFRTAYDVSAAPVLITAASFDVVVNAPRMVRLPHQVTSGMCITIEQASSKATLAQLTLPTLRVFIDGEPSFCAAMRDALFMRTVCAYAELGPGQWKLLPAVPILPAGFAEQDALIPFPARSHPAYRVLTEYFVFPDKFNFFDIDIGAVVPYLPPDASCLTLHLAIAGMRADDDAARMLASLSPANLLLGCTPIVNLFRKAGVPIAVTHQSADYPILPDAVHARSYEVYTVESVQMMRQGARGQAVTEFRPFYSLRHGEGEAQGGHYFVVRRDEALAKRSPGHEQRISFVDVDFKPLALDRISVSLDLMCTNRELPTKISCGLPTGDLHAPSSFGGAPIRLVRRPSAPRRFPWGHGAQWRLISHLCLNHHSLVQEGAAAFREMLTLYDLSQSAISRRQIRGIIGLSHQPTTAWQRARRGTSLVHGIEVRMTLDENAFVGSGMHLFVQVIENFLGLYVQITSFTELVIMSEQTGEELVRCKPRNGDMNLV